MSEGGFVGQLEFREKSGFYRIICDVEKRASALNVVRIRQGAFPWSAFDDIKRQAAEGSFFIAGLHVESRFVHRLDYLIE